MKTLNPNTKQARHYIYANKESSATELHHVYGRHSETKEFAFRYCKDLCYGECGYDIRILSVNTFQFVCAWRVENNLRVETKNNSYIIPKAF